MNQTSPKDVFLHLFSIVALYISAASFLTLAFQIINIGFPDRLDYYGLQSSYGALRWALAALIIIFPAYAAAQWFLERGYRLHPATQMMRTRKWLVYFTLFAAAVIVAGDAVALIYTLLNGDLALRFVLKVIAVLFVAASVFGYYFVDIRRADVTRRSTPLHVFVAAMIGIVALLVVVGFLIVGSPGQERLRRFDERRVQDLQTLQSEIINQWRLKEKLPNSLDALRDTIRGFVPPKDPATDASYEYAIKAPLEFELCATFQTPSASIVTDQQNWEHGAGRTCFNRVIDKDLYPPQPKTPKL